MFKIATYNLENLFTRPTAMSGDTDAEGRKALEHHGELNAIVAKDTYTDSDKARLIALSNIYKFHLLDQPKTALIQLQKVRGQLFRKPKNGPLQVVANGRGDWTGWFELRRQDVKWPATFNTGRVIVEVGADILICIEVENRPTLERFNLQVLDAEFHTPYPYLMVVDGNDERGIDVGILSRFPIDTVRSHVHEPNPSGNGRLFSRDCPEYDVLLPGGERLVVIPNHLKSKRNGNDTASQARRLAQAKRAHAIAVAALDRSKYVVVAGDMNDSPESAAIAPLLSDGFADVMTHASYPTDRPGTYQTGLPKQKIDYLVLSPQLLPKLQEAGIERRGSYHPGTWAPFDTVTKAADEASDHHCVWGNLAF